MELCKSVGSAASWNGPQADCEVPGTGHSLVPDTAGASTKVCWLHLCHLELFREPVVAGLKKPKPTQIKSLPSFRTGDAPYEPCLPSSAQLVNKDSQNTLAMASRT
eukprot:1156371-Pelagomonas_calceolata.AAC.5